MTLKIFHIQGELLAMLNSCTAVEKTNILICPMANVSVYLFRNPDNREIWYRDVCYGKWCLNLPQFLLSANGASIEIYVH